MSWYVTANEINQWSVSHSRQTQETLSLLIKKLIVATVKSKYIHFPSGDSVLTGGWDGILEVEKGNEFILSGKSYWEFGTNKSINSKAQSDYKKRTDTKSDKDISYIFATTQTWAKKDEFETEKNKENKWKAARGINSDDLETWLFLAPSVHLWFAKLIGKRPTNALDIEQILSKWSSQTKVKLSTDLVVVSREKEKKELRNIGQAISNGHYILEASESVQVKNDENIEIELSKIRKEHKREVLLEMGVHRDKTLEIIEDTKGFFHAIVKHQFLGSRESLKPNWIASYDINILSTILFINSWDRTNKFDIKILEELSDFKYKNLEIELHKLASEKEMPIRLVGNIWQVISKVNLWIKFV